MHSQIPQSRPETKRFFQWILKWQICPLAFAFGLLLSSMSLVHGYDNLSYSSEPPIIPVGEDAYLMWDRLPYQRIGVRAYMRSTYDRTGGNRSADASNFLYQESDTFNTTLDVRGPGILYFKRTNHFHGSPWHYEVDGQDFIVKETATDDPINAKDKYTETTFIPEDLFPNPLTWTWSITKGADLMWRPLPFEDSFRFAYSRTFYGTGYYIYHLFPPGIKHVSRPIRSWDKSPPDPAVLELINRSGSDIAPKGKGVETYQGKINLAKYSSATVAELEGSPTMIRAIQFSAPRDQAEAFGKCRLRITWDHRWHASIDAPLDLFHGAGVLDSSIDREYLVKGFPLVIRFDQERIYLSCYWPMPFFKHAKIELEETNGQPIRGIDWEIRTAPYPDPLNQVGYFHATYTDHPDPKKGKDNIFLDTRTVEGGGLWSGSFVGMSWIFSRRGNLRTLEGDPRFFFDDSKTPQAWGTGTEEWGGGGDYWGGVNMTIPFAGHPTGKRGDDEGFPEGRTDMINSAYRFLIADNFPFGRRAVIGMEHGGINQSTEHYSGVAYWYGIDAPSLHLTDQLDVCDPEDAANHGYDSPTAEPPYTLVSRYEWGPDRTGQQTVGRNQSDSGEQREIYFPAEEDKVRIMKGGTKFTVTLDPENLGVMLRRKFDYLYPNQGARVSVRAAGQDTWNAVGEWYTAGSNTCVYSRPTGRNFSEAELAPTEHNVITSNRRWREEEFLLPRHFTEGVEKLEVRLEFIPNNKELYPGFPFPAPTAWSESRYWVYCYKMPEIRDIN
jgi:hypothetical protein